MKASLATTLRMVAVGLVSVALMSCSTMGEREGRSGKLARYEAAAGEPVRHFNYLSLYSWEPLSDGALAIWTRPKEAWLLTVTQPCFDLSFVQSIGLSAVLGNNVGTMDYVLAGKQRCRIITIRPLHLDKLRESRQKSSFQSPSGGT
ncbi:MAG: hypothetical protein KDI75_00715 [Xanthomonadales bacterium]|nr:hypothetical protein [Xanthomonadales bacterium]